MVAQHRLIDELVAEGRVEEYDMTFSEGPVIWD